MFLFSFLLSVIVSISVFASRVGVPAGITSSAVGLEIGAITAGIKKYISIIKKKRKKHNTIILLGKACVSCKINTANKNLFKCQKN